MIQYPDKMRPLKIISGGQSGSDRGGLEAARRLGISTGGAAPSGFWTENGAAHELGSVFGLHEIDGGYRERTIENVVMSDGTVVFYNRMSPGTGFTLRCCKVNIKPVIANPDAVALREFVQKHNIKVLNVAGNRESVSPGMQALVERVIMEAFGE